MPNPEARAETPLIKQNIEKFITSPSRPIPSKLVDREAKVQKTGSSSWKYDSFIVLGFFTIFTLGFKIAANLGLSPAATLAPMFGIGAISYGATLIRNRSVQFLNGSQFFNALLMGVCCWSGNWLQLLAIKLAPNAGYPQAIIACEVIFVSLLSVALFRSTLTLSKFGGAILCALGGACLGWKESTLATETINSSAWLFLSIGSMCIIGLNTLLFKRATTLNSDPAGTLTIMLGLSSVLFAIQLGVGNEVLPLNEKLLLPVLMGSLIYFSAKIELRAVGAAPNPGYAQAIMRSAGATASLIAPLHPIFGSSLSLVNFIGIVMITGGVTIVCVDRTSP